jgi:hypothetical protein
MHKLVKLIRSLLGLPFLLLGQLFLQVGCFITGAPQCRMQYARALYRWGHRAEEKPSAACDSAFLKSLDEPWLPWIKEEAKAEAWIGGGDDD